MSWGSVSLGDVCGFVRGPFGGSLKKEIFQSEGFAVFEQQHAINNQFSNIRYFVDEAKFDEMKRFELKAGELIMSCSGTMGKVAIAPPDVPRGIINQALLKISPLSNVDVNFLLFWMESDDFQQQLEAVTSGAAIKNVASVAVLKQLKFPLPPLEEQKRIAGILDQADALRRLRTRALEKLNTLGQAIFHEMFVENASSDWESVKVEDVVRNARTGPFGSQLLVSEFVAEGIPVLGIDNVVQNKFVWAKERYISTEKYADLKRYTVLPGDVMITIMGTCGRCAVVPDDIPVAINTKHICCVSLDKELILPEFLQAAFLNHPFVLRQLGVQSKGAVMPGLNMGIIKGIELPLPPMGLQRRFANSVMTSMSEKAAVEASLSVSQSLFASLQHRAFRGEL